VSVVTWPRDPWRWGLLPQKTESGIRLSRATRQTSNRPNSSFISWANSDEWGLRDRRDTAEKKLRSSHAYYRLTLIQAESFSIVIIRLDLGRFSGNDLLAWRCAFRRCRPSNCRKYNRRPTTSQWKNHSRRPMRDGVTLYADVYRPVQRRQVRSWFPREHRAYLRTERAPPKRLREPLF